MNTQQKYGLVLSMFEDSQIEPIEVLKYLGEKTNYVEPSDVAEHFNLSTSGAQRLLNIVTDTGFCECKNNRIYGITPKGSDFLKNADAFLSTIE